MDETGPRMKACAAGMEVGAALVQASPSLSLTRSPASTQFLDEGFTPAAHTGWDAMEVLFPRCAGLDVQKDLRAAGGTGKRSAARLEAATGGGPAGAGEGAHRFLLRQHLRTIEQMEATVEEFEARIGSVLEPFRTAVERLTTIPGISTTAAHVLLAEIGADMTVFPSAGLASPTERVQSRGWTST